MLLIHSSYGCHERETSIVCWQIIRNKKSISKVADEDQ